MSKLCSYATREKSRILIVNPNPKEMTLMIFEPRPRNWNNYSWSGGDSWVEFIRFRPGADKSVVNARIDAMIDKYRPAEDKKEYGYTAFVQPSVIHTAIMMMCSGCVSS